MEWVRVAFSCQNKGFFFSPSAGLYCLLFLTVSIIQTTYWSGSSGLVGHELWRLAGRERVWSGWETAGELVSPAGSLCHKIPGFQCRAVALITMPANLMYFLFLIPCHHIGRLDLALSKPQIFKLPHQFACSLYSTKVLPTGASCTHVENVSY